MNNRSTSHWLRSERTTTWLRSWGVAALVFAAVVLCLLPVVLGSASLFFRDVLNFHWPAKVEQVRAWKEGVLPFVDLWRSGGQPGVGNLNTLPLYPGNLLLLLVGGSLKGLAWAFNAHLWLHLALAPLAFFWMARGLGLRREGAWMGAVLFGSSGFAVSMLGFYNLVAALVWMPVFLGALMRTVLISTVPVPPAPVPTGPVRPALGQTVVSSPRRSDRWWLFLVLAGAWALLLLSGDPVTSVLALLAGLVCCATLGCSRSPRHKCDRTGVLFGASALLAGTLVAWPQFHALLGALDGSVRATLGYSAAGVLRGSWHPAMLADSLVPFFLGTPNQLFWGARFHAGAQPLFYSFFPGVLALVLGAVALAQRERRRELPLLVGLLWVGLGLFVALGSFNPLVTLLSQWTDASWLRFPVKFWWWVALGLGLVGGHAFDGLIEKPSSGGPLSEFADRARTVARWICGAMGTLYLALIVAMAFGLFLPAYQRLIGGPAAGVVAAEAFPRLMMAVCLSLVVCAVFWVVVGSGTFLRRGGWVVLVVLHVVSQMVVLRPLYPTLPTAEVLTAPEILQGVEHTAVLAHGSVGARFEQTGARDAVALSALQRSAQHAGYPSAGVTAGYRYQLNSSPEGLDSYLPGFFGQALKSVPDAAKVRLLEALGVTHLVVERPVSSTGLVLERSFGSGQDQVFRYALAGARRVVAAPGWFEASSPQSTLDVLLDPQFDPRVMVVIPAKQSNQDQPNVRGMPRAVRGTVARGTAANQLMPRSGAPPITLDILESDRHGMRLRSNSDVPIIVALDRSFLPQYGATIDGNPVATTRANFVRLAVKVPAGGHEVVVFYQRSGWTRALLVSALGWLLMGVGATYAWRCR